MADCLRAWVTAEEHQSPHLVEDPLFIVCRLRERCHGQRKEEVLSRRARKPIVRNSNRPDTIDRKIEIDKAIKLLEHIIAAKEDLSCVA
jgi:hypothetical protein